MRLSLLFGFAWALAAGAEAPPNPDELAVDTSSLTPSPPRRFELAPQVSVISLTRLSLSQPGYAVSYLPAFEGLPSFQLVFSRPIADMGRLTLMLQASVGYGSRTGAAQITDLLSGARSGRPESLVLRWAPMSFTTRFAYRIRDFTSIRPSIGIGLGNLFLVQESSSPGLSRSWTMPLVLVSPQLTFQDVTAFHWLGGFSFGATFIRSLSTSNLLTATSLDLSINILL